MRSNNCIDCVWVVVGAANFFLSTPTFGVMENVWEVSKGVRGLKCFRLSLSSLV